MTITMVDIRRRLQDSSAPDRLCGLGFRAEDAAALQQAAAAVLTRPDDLEAVATYAERLVAQIGDFTASEPSDTWSGVPSDTNGVLPLLALLVTAPDVADWHARRGIPADISTASLSDLGQQVWVHRLTYGTFGLETYDWMTVAWSGALYWLGRLQFNLEPADDAWVLSTHIPRTGPLTPESVDESFAAARPFFASYFPEYPVRDIVCTSWLLDPTLAVALPDSNLAAFQRRWELTGRQYPGDADVLYFVFARRGPVELADLPRDTGLQRTILDRLTSGQGWSSPHGRLRR
jgi:GNAT-like C-terminal domain/N-acyltransferase N-terminal domain